MLLKFATLKPLCALIIVLGMYIPTLDAQSQIQNETYRPLIHFTPQKGWMNDPNGMVYYNGTYHLFFQHNPDATVWGPMHWGHATSRDLIHWEEQPIALYPDALGTIFSGSAVIDKNNTAGFGANAMVAIYTNHNHAVQKGGFDTYETQGIAYSLDEGKTWTKYKGNPVLPNPNIRDFRDPKVFWLASQQKWIMTLATLDHITFYSSPNLKEWKEESKFGKNIGAHGGVWECPDLIPFEIDGKQIWVLIVNLNPGGPNGGSATQYFVGDFDGTVFKPYDTQTRWLDYGPDEYAGVTWSNTGERKIFIGWMSNWKYANVVPTAPWRSAMTIARELSVSKLDGRYLVASYPVKELNDFLSQRLSLKNKKITNYELSKKSDLSGASVLTLTINDVKQFEIILSNEKKERVVIGYDPAAQSFYIDRAQSGMVSFNKQFINKHTAPRLVDRKDMDLTLVIDRTSVELFADGGLTVMTEIFFPTAPYTNLTIQSSSGLTINQLELSQVKTNASKQ